MPTTPPRASARRSTVATRELVDLGGTPQRVVVRGHDAAAPILLWLHGGPGGAELGSLRARLATLEQDFLVVHWDQRGTGGSYSASLPPESLTIPQLLSDAAELAALLCARFQQERLYVVGHSFGAALGLLFASRYPHLVHGYVGVNQPVHRPQEERRSYDHVLAVARSRSNAKAVRQLEAIGPPEAGAYADLAGTLTQRRWLSKLGQVTADPRDLNRWMRANVLTPENTWRDRLLVTRALRFSMQHLWAEFAGLDLAAAVPALEVPASIVSGAADHICDAALTERYVADLRAPWKSHVRFEASGHLAYFEEPERFAALIRELAAVGARG